MPDVKFKFANGAVKILDFDSPFRLVDRDNFEQAPVEPAVPTSYLWINYPIRPFSMSGRRRRRLSHSG